ncbi:DUF2975 domain-containing protein [Flavobacterium sp.]|uniref:DUF2975 domain-containing protein n=1 Tax=Flavobacterium sp. TaxID=239 RepID=UPI00286CCB77|nr:DUF2975 domain-containing protein [Flavobacterium sp.]
MKKLQILKNLLDLFWLLSMISLLAILLFVPFLLTGNIGDYPVKIKGQEILSTDFFSKTVILVNVVSGILFIYSVYLLRKVVNHFQRRDIFNEEVIRYFNLIGKLIIASSLISNVSLSVFNAVKRNHIGLSLDFGGYDSFILSICLGLFFMVISEVFKIAKNIKEENELTI